MGCKANARALPCRPGRLGYTGGVTALEKEILIALCELDATVQTMATAQPRPNLLPLFARLETLAGQLPADADPQLRHFLQRKSYEKARQLLDGRRIEERRGSIGA